jgi:hypothetical protein
MRRKYNCPFYNYTILEWYEDQISESDQKGTETEHCKICELGIKMWGKFLFQAVFWIKNFMKGNIYRHQCWNPSLTKGPPIWVRMFRSGVRLRILHRNDSTPEQPFVRKRHKISHMDIRFTNAKLRGERANFGGMVFGTKRKHPDQEPDRFVLLK